MENIDNFINQLINDKKVSGLTDEVREVLAEDLKQRLMTQIDRAIIEALPEDKAVELATKLDEEGFGDEQVAEFVQATGLDTQKISLETMLRFRNFYLGAGK